VLQAPSFQLRNAGQQISTCKPRGLPGYIAADLATHWRPPIGTPRLARSPNSAIPTPVD
jgi:hypothetical protein